MAESREIRQKRQCSYSLYTHLVFLTKCRGGVFGQAALEDLREIFKKICLDFGCELVDFLGHDDLVHLIVSYPPKVAISGLVNSLKGVSSRRLRELHPEIRPFYNKDALWSPSYLAVTEAAPPQVMRGFLEQDGSALRVTDQLQVTEK